MTTTDIIHCSHAGDKCATLALVEKFNPILKRFAYKLGYEDAYYDLVNDFLVFIRNFNKNCLNQQNEGSVISYISAAIRSFYTDKLEHVIKSKKVVSLSELNEEEQYYVEASQCCTDDYFQAEFSFIDELLTNREATVIKSIYILGYSAAAISEKLGISRQAVNQAKKRALRKLNKALAEGR